MDTAERTILLVDDDADFAEMCSRVLQSMGCRVHVALDGFQALRFLDEEVIDVCLIDQAMPEISGLELVSEMRRRQHKTPVYFCTGFDTTPVTTLSSPLQIKGILSKPLDRSTLARILL